MSDSDSDDENFSDEEEEEEVPRKKVIIDNDFVCWFLCHNVSKFWVTWALENMKHCDR